VPTTPTPGAAEIETAYRIKVANVRRFPSVYHQCAAFCVQTETGDTVLLKPVWRSDDFMERLQERLEQLRRSGYHDAPEIVLNQYGKWITHLNKKQYYAVEWVPGQPMHSASPRTYSLGQCLANLHQAPCSGEYQMNHKRDPLDDWTQKVRRSSLYLRRSGRQTGSAAAWFKQHGEECNRMGQQALKILNSPGVRQAFAEGYQTPSWLHGDVTCPNVIQQDDETVRLIDWELLCVGHPLYELTKALANTTHFERKAMTSLLAGYTSIRSLSQPERDVLRAWFRFPREAWDASRKIAQGESPTVFDILRDTWVQRKRAIRMIDDWAAQTSD
jgi:Ser/Thr protein kinase RdoA (MazF antagonist)